MKLYRHTFAVLAALLLAACATPGASDVQVRVYDLGLSEPAARLIGVRICQVRASAPLDSTDMQYRLAYRDAAELLSFSQSRWDATPAELVRKRFVRSVEPAPGVRCTLDIEVNEFSQVFSARDKSNALVELRLVLADASGRLAKHTVRVSLPGAGADTAQGVAMMVRATEEASAAAQPGWGNRAPARSVRRILNKILARHSRGSGNPVTFAESRWVPAFAGTTGLFGIFFSLSPDVVGVFSFNYA